MATQVSAPTSAAGRFVDFAKPAIGDTEIGAVVAALESGWLSTGPRVREFEQAFAAYVGAPHAVAVNSCTAALHLSLLAAGIGPGDEVITSPLTFCATANVVLHTGATPVFADIDPVSMNILPAAVEAALTPRTRAILPVHFAGRPAELGALRAIANRHGLIVIEDAAHAVGASFGTRRVGSISEFTCFSFYATKNLTTGEGGMVTTASSEAAEWMRIAALHGMSKDAWNRYAPSGGRLYEVVTAGYKYNMMDLQAALGLVQLSRLPEMQRRRLKIWRRYDAGLGHLALGRPSPPEPGTEHARHLYTVLVDERAAGRSRDGLRQALRDRGVATSVHFTALHLFPYYAERLGLQRGMFPSAEMVSDRTMSLPLTPALTDAEVERVVDALQSLVERA
jgi:dTDP-4-amino-4,6-dideoxygalactose transaminase